MKTHTYKLNLTSKLNIILYLIYYKKLTKKSEKNIKETKPLKKQINKFNKK